MTIESILTAVSEWANQLDLTHTLREEQHPGAFLDLTALLTPAEREGYGPGLCLTIHTPADGPLDAKIGFWIPAKGSKGAWCAIEGDSGEIGTDWIPDFSDEKTLLGFIESKVEQFLCSSYYELLLDEWLEAKGINYSLSPHEGFCGEATQHDLTNWAFYEFSDLEGYDLTLGISGLGEAATFSKDEEGWIDFLEYGSGLTSRELFLKWLEKTIGKQG